MNMFHMAALMGAASLLAIGTACNGTGDDKSGTCDTSAGPCETVDTFPDTDTTDTTDTDVTPPGPPSWDTTAWADRYDAIITCNASDTITFQLRTTNWGYTPRLYLADTRFAGAWTEEHTLESVEPGADGTYEVFERTLSIVASANDQDPDVSTILNCERYVTGAGDESVTLAAAVYDSAGSLADCITFGKNPEMVTGDSLPGDAPTFSTAGCRDVNP